MSGVTRFGTVEIPAVEKVLFEMFEQDPPPMRQGYSNRADRQGVRQHWLSSKHKGMGAITGSETSQEDLLRYRYNDGLWMHHQGLATLPPVVTTQASLLAMDISGTRANNRRVQMALSTLPTSGAGQMRPYFGLLGRIFRQASITDHALEDSTVVPTDACLRLFETKANSTRYLVYCSGGATTDVSGIADPTLTPPVLTQIFPLSANDWVVGETFPHLGSGFNIWYGKIGGVTGIFETKFSDALNTTPRQVVSKATQDVPNPSNTVVTGSSKSPGSVFQDISSGLLQWASVGNAIASDNAYVTVAVATSGALEFASPLSFTSFGFAIPPGSLIRGITATVEGSVSTDGGSGWTIRPIVNLELLVGGTVVTESLHDTATGYTTTDQVVSYGSTSDAWAALSADDVNSAEFGLVASAKWQKAVAVEAAVVRIDHVTMTITYVPSGAATSSIPIGGYVVGVDKFDLNSMYVYGPEYAEDRNAVNVPRILYKLTFEYDPEGDRPLATLVKVPTALSHVEGASFGAGGLFVFGDTLSGLGKQCKLLRSDGQVIDTGFGSVGQGFTENWGIVNLYEADRMVIAQCCLEAETIEQDWAWFDGAWNPIGPRIAITKFPIAYGSSAAADPLLRRRYTFRPTTTATTVDRTFQPRNMLENPLYTNTAEVKHDGVLTVQMPDMDLLGPVESNKALLTAWNFSRDVSATNTIRLRYSTDGGSNFTTWTTFTAYAAKATLSTPVSFRSVILEIGLNHTASSASTPNGLPILIEGISRWRPMRKWTVLLDWQNGNLTAQWEGGPDSLFTALTTLVNTLPVQTLSIDDSDFKASWDGFHAGSKPGPDIGNVAVWEKETTTLIFTEVPS